MTLTLRDAVPADVAAIAPFHVRQWRIAYRDLAPPLAHQVLDEAHRLNGWAETLALPPPAGVILAVQGETLAGFVSFGPTSEPVFAGRGRISLLYVDAAWQGQGLGARLLRAAQARLVAAGLARTALAVVEGNTAARAFYAAMGGIEMARYTDPGPIWASDNVLVTWDDALSSQSPSKGRVAPSRP